MASLGRPGNSSYELRRIKIQPGYLSQKERHLVPKIYRLLFILFGLAAILLSVSYLKPRVVSAYYQVRGNQRLDQVVRKAADQFRLDLTCEKLHQEEESRRVLLIASVKDLNVAVSRNPKNSQAYLQLGKAQCLMGNYEEAKHSFQKYTELRPKNPLGYLRLGFVNEKLGDQNSANLAWSDARISSADFLEVGRQSRKEKRYEEAAEWFNRATGISPQDGASWYEFGLLYNEMGQSEKAIEAFQRSLISPGFSSSASSVYYQIGKLYLVSKNDTDLLKSRTAFEKAIEIDQFIQEWEKADSHYRLGIVLRQKGESPASYITHLEQAIAINPKHVNARLALGKTYEDLKEYDKAVAEIQAVLEIDPKNTWALFRLGEIYRKRGERDIAIETYSSILEINPHFEQAIARLNELAGNSGD